MYLYQIVQKIPGEMVLYLVIYGVALVCALHAILRTRTSQAALAWILGLFIYPYLAIPLYLVFGRGRFNGYIKARRIKTGALKPLIDLLLDHLLKVEEKQSMLRATQDLSPLPITSGNSVTLYMTGDVAYPALFAAIREARTYVLLEFYILRDDRVGQELAEILIKKVQQGVAIYVLYDEFGCYFLKKEFLSNLRSQGVNVNAFGSTRGRSNRFQINFRNHRKIAVIDGTSCFFGGMNIGLEYTGSDPKWPHWRDLMAKVEGVMSRELQLIFLEDWFWATKQILTLSWDQIPKPNDSNNAETLHDCSALVLASGPADPFDSQTIAICEALYQAEQRAYFTTPYFIPDGPILIALRTAALRGVDVRLLLSGPTDQKVANYAKFAYLEGLMAAGVKIYEYQEGLLHQKTFLIDESIGSIGSVNLDTRSLRLNFEISAFFFNTEICRRLAEEFHRNLERSVQLDKEFFTDSPIWFRLTCNAARLFAPIL